MINYHDQADAVEMQITNTQTSSTDSDGVDLRDYTGIGKVILQSAAGTGTTPTLDIKLQDSADDTTYADITGVTFTQVDDTAGGSTEGIRLAIDEVERYVRVVSTIAGTDTPTFIFGVALVATKQKTA